MGVLKRYQKERLKNAQNNFLIKKKVFTCDTCFYLHFSMVFLICKFYICSLSNKKVIDYFQCFERPSSTPPFATKFLFVVAKFVLNYEVGNGKKFERSSVSGIWVIWKKQEEVVENPRDRVKQSMCVNQNIFKNVLNIS